MANNLQVLRSKVFVASSVFLILFISLGSLPVLADQVDAANVISSTKNTLLNCYSVVKEVEAAGANVTDLVDTLNRASLLLSKAEAAFAQDDFDAALSLGQQSQTILENFISDANSMLEAAKLHASQDYLFNVVGSIVGTFAVVAIGFVAWVFYKRRIEKKAGIQQ